MKVRKVEIAEKHDGEHDKWTVLSGDGIHVLGVFKTAFEALQSIKDQDADTTEGQITIIEWTVFSRIGRLVVQVLAAK